MREISSSNFGFLIAFVLPGFLTLWGASHLSPVLRAWLVGAEPSGPTVSGFLYVTLASVAGGLIVSTIRWALLDTLHHATGLPRPDWDFSRLQKKLAAYKLLHDIHYKFYQFNGNCLVAVLFTFLARRSAHGFFTLPLTSLDAALLLLSIVLFIGSRDTLRNYYDRVSDLLGTKEVVTVEDKQPEEA